MKKGINRILTGLAIANALGGSAQAIEPEIQKGVLSTQESATEAARVESSDDDPILIETIPPHFRDGTADKGDIENVEQMIAGQIKRIIDTMRAMPDTKNNLDWGRIFWVYKGALTGQSLGFKKQDFYFSIDVAARENATNPYTLDLEYYLQKGENIYHFSIFGVVVDQHGRVPSASYIQPTNIEGIVVKTINVDIYRPQREIRKRFPSQRLNSLVEDPTNVRQHLNFEYLLHDEKEAAAGTTQGQDPQLVWQRVTYKPSFTSVDLTPTDLAQLVDVLLAVDANLKKDTIDTWETIDQ